MVASSEVLTVVHLKTQNGQSYGSVRRCCEFCGVMIWGGDQPTWTDDIRVYKEPPKGYINCRDADRMKGDSE